MRIAGYASLSLFREKPAYDKTVESSVYVDQANQRRSVGKALMQDIVRRAGALGYHAVVAVITGGNEVSVRLHQDIGFTYAGRLKDVGRKFGQWHDVYFYQLLLE